MSMNATDPTSTSSPAGASTSVTTALVSADISSDNAMK